VISFPLHEPIYIVCVLFLILSIASPLARLLRIPQLVILIGLGAIVGNNILGILERNDQLILLEKIGLMYIMLMAGLQMDLANLRQIGSRSLIFGLLTFGIPMLIGIVSGYIWGASGLTLLLLGILYSPHTLISYPIVTRYKLAHLPVVSVAVGGTVVTSILTLMGLSLLRGWTQGESTSLLWIKLLLIFPMFVVSYIWLVQRFGQQLFKKNEVQLPVQFTFILTCLFIAAAVTTLLGMDAIVGAFVAGLALNQLMRQQHSLMSQLDFVSNHLFIPAFLISVGVLCDPTVIIRQFSALGLALGMVTGAVSGKFLAAWLASRWFSFSRNEAVLLCGLTLSRAALVMVIALFGREAKLLDDGLFNSAIFYILVTCLFSPLIVERFTQTILESVPEAIPSSKI
jgi:Kef-type K+ transport system membrane component KefB